MNTPENPFAQPMAQAPGPPLTPGAEQPHIIIIGAGLSGLALAQGLWQNSISFTVHERERYLNPRIQGHQLKISESVAAKLRAILSPTAWSRFQSTCIETVLGETNVNAIDGRVTACRRGRVPKGDGREKPYTVDRGLLRQAMMEEIGTKIKFGSEFLRYEVVTAQKDAFDEEDEVASPGGVKAYFVDGSVEEGTLIVGADGPGSAVRKQFLPCLRTFDSGTCCIYGKSPLRAELQRRFPPEFRRWTTVVIDRPPLMEGVVKGLKTVTMVSELCRFDDSQTRWEIPEDYVHWVIMFQADMLAMRGSELTEMLKMDAPALALDITAEWHPSVRSVIELQEKSVTGGMKIFTTHSSVRDWPSSAYVTVLGDAVHVVSPSGGQGASTALQDSYELVQTIVNEGISTASIRRFEKKMRASAQISIIRAEVAGSRMLDLPHP